MPQNLSYATRLWKYLPQRVMGEFHGMRLRHALSKVPGIQKLKIPVDATYLFLNCVVGRSSFKCFPWKQYFGWTCQTQRPSQGCSNTRQVSVPTVKWLCWVPKNHCFSRLERQGGAEVKNACGSSRGAKFSFQNPHAAAHNHL